jgi:lysophospholipase L1-like esterase
MFWPPEKIRENYTALVDRIRARGGEVIIITPHLMMPEWMEKFGPAAQALREAAAERQVGLADVSLAWQNVRLLGIPYQTLLANGINHPDDRGHKIFVDALLSFFPQASRAA